MSNAETMAETTKIVHRFRLDELRAVSQGDQKNQPTGGPIYFSYATHPEFDFLAREYPSPFRMVGPDGPMDIRFHTLEQYYQWQKAIKAGDIPTSQKINAVEHGHADECRELGKSITGFNKQDWDTKRAAMIETGVFCRFWSPDPSRQNAGDMLRRLFNTGERELVYAVEEDIVWGIGFRPGDAEKNRESWGENLLGKSIMKARRMCREYVVLRVCPGYVLYGEHEHEETVFRKALSVGKLKWGKEGKLEVVKEKCSKGDELDTLRVLARIAARHKKNSPMATIMWRLKQSKKFYDEMGNMLESFGIE